MVLYSGNDHEQMVAVLESSFVTSIRGVDETLKYAFGVSDLLHEEKRELILQEQAIQQGLDHGGTGSVAVGTLFAKRYSVWVMAVIAACTLYDTLLNIKDDVVRFEMNGTGSMRYETRLERSLDNGSGLGLGANIAPTSEVLAQRRTEISMLRDRLQLHLGRIFESVAAATGANTRVMHALVAHNVQQLLTRVIEDHAIWKTDKRLELIKHDAHVWLEESTDNTFSTRLQRFEHPEWEGPPLLLRRYCCLAYQVGSGSSAHGYCNTCPKLDSESRWRMLLKSDD
ncbi:(2Fe-2S)-binding protein [Paenibacillus polysaccharolyticus]|uniref:(2Fe-2S)-binding protein n=1 Tax=Paenibacillus polysaccharolyticus TaxID=582692 RepID=UPI00203F90C3|nr:(2Fe-2S)-binding protein [Paenibacillus polysaccharolyticus]MCM3131643.1 (2Fe-2S)-binding protein [Paenibacillus polysaccharolyticus]